MHEALFRHVPVGILVVDPDGTITLANPAVETTFGYEPGELIGVMLEALVPAGHRSQHVAHRAAYTHAPRPRRMGADVQLMALRKDGTQVPVEVGLFPAPEAGRVFATVIDVSERRAEREAFHEAQRINKTGTWSYEVDRDEFRYSPEVCRILGIPPVATLPRSVKQASIYSPESQARLGAAFERALEEGRPYEVEVEIPGGPGSPPRFAVSRCEPRLDSEGRVTRLYGSLQDITSLVQERQQRQELLERLAVAKYAAELGIWEWDLDSGDLSWDDRMFELYGIEPREVSYEDWRAKVHPDDVDRAEADLQRAVSEGSAYRQEFRIRHPEGQRHIAAAAALHHGSSGRRYMVGVNMDVTASARAQQRLRQRQEQWDRFSAASNNLLWNHDLDTGEVERNVAFQTALGYAPDEVKPTSDWWVERLHSDDRARVLAEFEHGLETGLDTTEYTYRFRRRDGGYALIQDRVYFMRDAEGRAYRALGAMKDITEQERHEEERRRANNLESLGLLAGGIAHDFNNLLTSIIVHAELVEFHADQPEDVRKLAYRIVAAVENARHMTRQLLTFSKGGAPSRRPIPLERLVRDQVTFSLRGSSIQCAFECEEGLSSADVDRGQIGQVIQNLVLNAQQAMPTGGRLHVSARNLREDEGLTSSRDQRFLELRIRDNGAGMPEHILSRVFDPYFSTKSDGHGLGLSICHSIVERHGGSIRVESAPGKGTTFIIRLPATRERRRSPGPAHEVIPGAGKVLIVDDLAEVRTSVTQLLVALGYEVVAAEDVHTAVEAVRDAIEDDARFDVVLTDLTIPGTEGGVAVLRGVRSLDPGLKVAVTSGYANDPILASYEAHGFDGKLVKPIRMRALSSLLAGLRAG